MAKNYNVGMKVRATKEMEVFYGQDYVSGIKQTRTLPVKEDQPKIFSGEPIYAVRESDDLTSWTKDISEKAPCFAVTDSDRFDAQASGKLLAVSGLDTFVLGTVFYDHTHQYEDGDPLYVQNIAVSATSLPELNGIVASVNMLTNQKPTTQGTVPSIVGYVVDGIIELKGSVAPAISANSNWALNPEGYQTDPANTNDRTVTGGPALWTEATPSATMLKFATHFVGAAKNA